MTAQPTHWLEYGDPIDGRQAVEARHRITYATGPNESREDDVTEGVLSYDALDAGWEDNPEHVHEDGSLLLSALPDGDRERIMAAFEPVDADERLRRLVDAGLSAAEALDYYMTVDGDWTQDSWAQHRGISQQAVSKNVDAATQRLESAQR